MLTPATLGLPEATPGPSVGGHFPELIDQCFQALGCTPFAVSRDALQEAAFFKS